MSLLKMLMEAQGGQGLGQLGRQFGIDEDKVGGLAEMLAPAIAQGAKKRAQEGGLEAVLGQLMGEAQGSYLDDPSAAAAPEGQAQGQQFLEQILGSREAGNELAAEAANRSGLDLGAVMQFLPAIAAMLQGGMQRSMPDSSIQGMLSAGGGGSGGGLLGAIGGLLGGGGSQGSGGGLDMLTQMLDADGDGSALDDILEKVMKR
jgi:hypothetical protein